MRTVVKEQVVPEFIDREAQTHPRLRELIGGLEWLLSRDPECAFDERLGVYIRTDVPPEKAVEQFVAFDSEWGDRFQDLTDGQVLLNIESKS